MKILNTIKNFDEEAKKILEKVGNVEYRQGAVHDSEAVIVGLGLRLDKDFIDKYANLKVIATATTGLNHIDIDYAKAKGIKVLSLRDEDLKEVTSTAELAFGLLLALVRRIPESFNDVKKGNWDREKFLGNNLSGKTLGIVGLGRLGSMMEKYAKAFGMNVIAYDKNKDSADFETLVKESDIISIHVHLKEDTKNMFNKEVFKNIKPSAYLINTSRGEIVNEKDLIQALEQKQIAGYATDVLTGEVEFKKDASQSALAKYSKFNNNVIITPHIGGYTKESRLMTDDIIANKVSAYVKTIK